MANFVPKIRELFPDAYYSCVGFFSLKDGSFIDIGFDCVIFRNTPPSTVDAVIAYTGCKRWKANYIVRSDVKVGIFQVLQTEARKFEYYYENVHAYTIFKYDDHWEMTHERPEYFDQLLPYLPSIPTIVIYRSGFMKYRNVTQEEKTLYNLNKYKDHTIICNNI